MTELDEYVWRKDGAYGFEVGEYILFQSESMIHRKLMAVGQNIFGF